MWLRYVKERKNLSAIVFVMFYIGSIATQFLFL